ncbi:MAG: transposase [Phycisphaerae bacterium]|jgi:REP element-mobilizing transposase RayT
MAQSLTHILIHLIFSTKERYPFLTPSIRPELHAYAATVLTSLDSPAILLNSVEDHVHALLRFSKNRAFSGVVQELKTSTSKWLKTKGGMLSKFAWQNGYGAFSVSASQLTSVRDYIADQEMHHQTVTFQDEFRTFLSRHGVEFDERYVWG